MRARESSRVSGARRSLGRTPAQQAPEAPGSLHRAEIDGVGGIAQFHSRSYRLALALLGSPARRVRFRGSLQIARFDRLHGTDARSKPKFSVAVAVAAVAVGGI